MTKDNTEQGNPNVFGSEDSDDFFSSLEDSVNGMVQEPESESVETSGEQNPNNNTSEASVSQNPELDNLKKRYSDSSREAQNLRAQLNELKPFVPVLDAMKKDGKLVDHVRDYFKNGGQVNKNIKEELKLDDDFEFDPDEMVKDENSKSRQVFDKMVGNMVDKKAQGIMEQQQQQANREQYNANIKQQAAAFMEKHSMTADEFRAFTDEAKARIKTQGISFEDMYLLTNQSKVNQNIANSTKNDMLNQMQNVRNIPASVSDANNAGKPNNQTDSVFEALLSSDGNIEDLLG